MVGERRTGGKSKKKKDTHVMVIRNDFDPTAGRLRTREMASSRRLPEWLGRYDARLLSKGGNCSLRDSTKRVILGGFPKRIDIGRSIGFGCPGESRSIRTTLFSPFTGPSAFPTTE